MLSESSHTSSSKDCSHTDDNVCYYRDVNKHFNIHQIQNSDPETRNKTRGIVKNLVFRKWKVSSIFAIVHVIVLYLIMSNFLVSVYVDAKRIPKCSVCQKISDDFKIGLEKTAKSNYGGGNTNWEEKSLGRGSYAKSEIRMVEVMEYLCKGGDKDCHYILEEYEEMVETFWATEFRNKNNFDLHTWLCINEMKSCCPKNTFGRECLSCPGGVERPCSGNGDCEGGGTREGKGTCSCNHGYKGDLCDDCADDYFEETRNTTHTICEACHLSCKSGCYEAGPTGCEECATGYDLVDETCTDVDECTTENICEEDKDCVNNDGSYTCIDKPKVEEPTEETAEESDSQKDDEKGEEPATEDKDAQDDITEKLKDEAKNTDETDKPKEEL